ncbi:MAG: hypothetical protein JOZ19_04245 [Rubrobacter sp.]|nr:hypothetical protein [Rubrobacter sp.]
MDARSSSLVTTYGNRVWVFAPLPQVFRLPTWEEFVPAHLSQLDEVGPRKALKILAHLASRHPEERLTFLCFEADRRECRRGLLSEWWIERKLLIKVPELHSSIYGTA